MGLARLAESPKVRREEEERAIQHPCIALGTQEMVLRWERLVGRPGRTKRKERRSGFVPKMVMVAYGRKPGQLRRGASI